MNIGKQQQVIVVEPLSVPDPPPALEPEPAGPVPEPVEEPATAPAG